LFFVEFVQFTYIIAYDKCLIKVFEFAEF
jgi:hypothetical protein